MTSATVALLAGETVTTTGRHVRLVDARLTAPEPVQERIPLMVGGNGRRVLTFAARHADVVGITGLGATLTDGHHHLVRWSTDALQRTVELVSAASPDDRRFGIARYVVRSGDVDSTRVVMDAARSLQW